MYYLYILIVTRWYYRVHSFHLNNSFLYSVDGAVEHINRDLSFGIRCVLDSEALKLRHNFLEILYHIHGQTANISQIWIGHLRSQGH